MVVFGLILAWNYAKEEANIQEWNKLGFLSQINPYVSLCSVPHVKEVTLE